MARRGNLKMVDIRSYRHPKTGKEVQIKFDPNTNQFYANWAEVEYSDLKIRDLEKQLESAMVKNNAIAWSAVIEVELESPGVGVKFERFLIGDQAEGTRFLKVKWEMNVRLETPGPTKKSPPKVDYKTYEGLDIPEELRIQEARGFSWDEKERPFKPPVRARSWASRDADKWYLPYSQATWEGLQELRKRIHTLQQMLRALLNTDEGLARLEAGAGGRLELPAQGQLSPDEQEDD